MTQADITEPFQYPYLSRYDAALSLGADVRRREFITLLGGVAAAWPLAARAQQSAMPVVGFLNTGSPEPLRGQIAAFHDGMKQAGFIERQNFAIEYRWAEGQYDRLPALVADLIQRPVTILVAAPTPSALAAKAATSTLPVVFVSGVDPVKFGLVASLNRPGGNVTGVSFFTTALETKRLGLLHELLPQARVLAALINPNNPAAENQSKELTEAGRAIGVQLHLVNAASETDFDAVFAKLAQQNIGGLLISGDAFFNSRRAQLVAMAARHAVPTMYEWREFAHAGGLISYGTSSAEAYRQAGIYAARILNGTKPADLPVMQSTRFELVINLKTVKALGLTVPSGVLAIADEVIE